MAFTCVHEGIVISEGKLQSASSITRVEADLSFKIGAQLKSLRDVKSELVMQAKAVGANAIEDFTYGQKHRWLAIDDVAFWGKGVAVNISDEEYNRFANK